MNPYHLLGEEKPPPRISRHTDDTLASNPELKKWGHPEGRLHEPIPSGHKSPCMIERYTPDWSDAWPSVLGGEECHAAYKSQADEYCKGVQAESKCHEETGGYLGGSTDILNSRASYVSIGFPITLVTKKVGLAFVLCACKRYHICCC